MPHPSPPSPFRNILLRTLAPQDLDLIRPHLEPVALRKREVIVTADTAIPFTVFPESGIASVLVITPDGRRLEVGLFGRDGVSSTPVLLEADRTPFETMMQVEGAGWRMPTDALRRALARAPGLRTHLLRYVQAFTLQTGQTALANAGYSVEERLARWMLLCHDRVDGDDLPLTHEFLSTMLGARRPTVTLATHVLEGAGVIRARRGVLTVLDRGKLEGMAGDIYGAAEAEYARLFGTPLR